MKTQTVENSVYHIDFSTGKLVPLVTADSFPVGQILTYEDMKNPRQRYAVTFDNPGIYGQPVVCEDGHESTCAPSSIGRGGWRDTGVTLTPAELELFCEEAKQRKARAIIEAEAKTAATVKSHTEQRQQALANHPHLTPVAAGSYASAKHGAANIRQELKRAFPGIKFSVRSDVYSGGDSIDIRWAMGPTRAEVEAITGKYQEGSFNCMEDIYENDKDDIWTPLFGGAKYVSASREDGEAYNIIAGHLCDIFNIERPADNKFWTLRAEDDDKINGTTRGLMTATSFPAGAIITGVEHMPAGEENRKCGFGRTGFACFYRVTYTTPGAAAPKTPAAAPEQAPDTNTAPTVAAADAVTITENTAKQGIEIRFPAKPPAFLLESLKALGWRWSRHAGCWYAKATAEARAFAQTIADTWNTSQPA
jgi:hypothetical protein